MVGQEAEQPQPLRGARGKRHLKEGPGRDGSEVGIRADTELAVHGTTRPADRVGSHSINDTTMVRFVVMMAVTVISLMI